ncbi:hypothetical protein PybrP1_012400 [[Pythium] brassicae (nom. inval.)]|nr:hypothetical protein PybrP1_012400 [[Pythium] brassicae (nom. inval.)]
MSKRKVDPGLVDGDADGAVGSVAYEDPSVPPAKKRRTTQGGNLTNAQKRALCVRFASHKSTQQELCAWARAEFNLPHLPHQSTISKILARADELTSMATKDLAARRRGFVTHPELDTALCNWVLFARQSGAKLSGDMIKEKARQLAQRFGLASKMTFSNGWLGGFKKRHNIRLGGGTTTAASTAAAVSVGTPTATPATLDAALGSSTDAVMNALTGAGGADAAAFAHLTTAVPFAVRELQECVKLYAPADVFVMSETGLYYALPPEKPVGRAGRGASAAVAAAGPGRKETERFTILLAANADGSERLEPFVIGAAKLPPRALQCAAGGDDDAPPAQYRDNRKAWVTPVLFQEWHDDLFRVDAAQAARWVRECWFAVPPAVVKHFWDATEITAAPKPSLQAHHAVAALELAIDNEIVDAVTALHVARPLTIDEYVNPSDESVALHCTGTDELDFILSVSEGGAELGAGALRASGSDNGDAADRDSGDTDADLAVHYGAGVGAGAAGATSSVAALGGHTATSEQLLESLKVLLPELDRLRFDEHTKSSIRTAFRRLKDRESEHAGDTKQRQSATRRAMMVPSNGHNGSGAPALGLSLAASAVPGGSALHAVTSDHHLLAATDAALEHTVL